MKRIIATGLALLIIGAFVSKIEVEIITRDDKKRK